jgi:alpha-1,2-mannosyltransferase
VQATSEQRTRILVSALVPVAIACAVVLVMSLNATTEAGILGDLEIYRGAIGYGFGGGDLYAWVYEHPTVKGLGFTYPPFAALVLSWLVVVPLAAAKVVWTVLTFAVIAACLWLLTRPDPGTRVGGSPSPALRLAWTAGIAIPVLFTYPFLHNLVVGQVSLFVIALALFDHTLPPRWQGVLVGLAGAIKLTPLVFVPYYLLTRQWRQAAMASGTFAAATGLAFAVLPGASIDYWTDKLWQTGRVGRTDSTVNKSLLGLLARLLGDGGATKIVWVALALAVAALAYWRAAHAFGEDDLLGASLMVGALSVALSPISWPHHQLWLVLVAAWWVLQRGRAPLVLGLVLFVVFLGYPWFDDYKTAIDPLLRIGVELPALAVLLVLGAGPRPGAGRT